MQMMNQEGAHALVSYIRLRVSIKKPGRLKDVGIPRCRSVSCTTRLRARGSKGSVVYPIKYLLIKGCSKPGKFTVIIKARALSNFVAHDFGGRDYIDGKSE